MLYIHLAFEGFKVPLDPSGQPLDTLGTTRLSLADQTPPKGLSSTDIIDPTQ